MSVTSLNLNTIQTISNVTVAEPTLATADCTGSKIPLSNELVKKGNEIFKARARLRDKIRLDNKIKTVAAAILVTIGLALIATGFALGAPVTIPFGVAAGMVGAGQVIGLVGAFNIPTKRILKDNEEQQFWNDLSSNSLSDLTKKRWNWYCVGSPYYGPVSGVSKITYGELIDHKIMGAASAKALESILYQSAEMSRKESSELDQVKNVKVMDKAEIEAMTQRIIKKYAADKEALNERFEAFRADYINAMHSSLT